jgi:G3E family GTPase
VDARHIEEQLGNEQAREQIAFADVIILNKIDIASADGVDDLLTRLRSLNPLARMHRAIRCDVDPRHVLDVRAFDLRNVLKLEPTLLDDTTHEHDADIQCVSIREFGAIDEPRFIQWLNQLVQTQGKDLLRIKGIVDLADEPRRFVFHGVHMTLDGRPGKPWKPDEPRLNELVFIGRELDAARLRSEFASCCASMAASVG